MKYCKTLSSILESENQGSCFMASCTESRKTLRRQLKSGYLVEPYYGLYARRTHWENLWYKDKVRHIAISITRKIKIKAWKYTGETGAALLGLDIVEEYKNHSRQMNIYVSCPYPNRTAESTNEKTARKMEKRQLKRVHLPDIIEDENGIRLEENHKKHNDTQSSASNESNKETNGTIKILKTSTFGHIKTPEESTIDYAASIYNILFVEAWTKPFRIALPTFDSACRKGFDLEKIYNTCCESYKFARYQQNTQPFYNQQYLEKSQNPYFANIDDTDIFARLRLLCNFASPKSENAGESLARAAMLELGFVKPYLQYEFPNNNNPEWPLRVDFAWKVNEGLIVGELDGTDKYLIGCGKNLDCDINHKSSDNFVDGNSSNENRALKYDRDAVKRERNRERIIYECGASKIVRFDFADVVDPRKLEKKLLYAEVPKVHV